MNSNRIIRFFKIRWVLLLLPVLLLNACYYKRHNPEDVEHNYVLVVHGGAGYADPEKMGEEGARLYQEAMKSALAAGEAVLRDSGSALDAVEVAIRILEDHPSFNAGKGAVFTAQGTNELDASIMEGKDHKAGAVAGVRRIKNPISAARMVMESSPHVMLSGAGADVFAMELGLEIVDTTYFFTQDSWDSYLRQREKASEGEGKHGTVGAVALDKHGNLAAGTSTGGMMMKKWGRIGDSPVIGAGTWADNASCAVSCTGHGEYFIRYAAAHEVAVRMEHRKWTLERAAHYVIDDLLGKQEVNGGLIAVDKYGNIAMPFNTRSMFRAYVKEGEESQAFIFKE